MRERAEWYVKSEDGNVYGPARVGVLKGWAKDGRIQPTSFLSRDRVNWVPAQTMPELEMKWLVEPEPGRVFGPFNRAFAIRLFKDGSAPPGTRVYALHELPVDEDEPPKVVEKVVEMIVEVPVVKIVEKIVEVPVEKVVEKIVEREVRVEVPVERGVSRVAERRSLLPQLVRRSVPVPSSKSPGAIFAHLDRARLLALEAAAQRELAKSRRFGIIGNLFGRKR